LHSIGVADEAESLAKTHGIDPEKAYTAGLLHDCAKDLGKDKSFELCYKYGVALDEVLTAQPDLIHSFLGAAVAKEEYGIDDCDILNAIRHHTTGRAEMSELEKIIYLADFFEPSRKPFDGMDKMRALAYESLDKAMRFALNHTIEYNNKKNRLIHPLSIQAAEYYNNKKGD
jgi:nicotinate-nucleotide adenylyltransferase